MSHLKNRINAKGPLAKLLKVFPFLCVELTRIDTLYLRYQNLDTFYLKENN